MESFAINFCLQVVQHFVRNPASAGTFKHVLLDIRNAVSVLFPGE